MTTRDTGLEAAYSLQTPDDNRDLYARWAADYDSTFAAAEAYALPQATAQAFVAVGGKGPVLDVGAGTGLCGAALAEGGAGPVDGLDISPEMLEVARGKGVYRDLLQVDLHAGVEVADGTYPGVVSSGTFTHGHVGPEVLEELLRLAAPGAVFALAINSAHYRAHGFEAAFEALGDRILELVLPEVRIYGDDATGAHKDDMAMIAVFRKA